MKMFGLLINNTRIVFIGIIMYPILKKTSEPLLISAGMFCIFGIIDPLLVDQHPLLVIPVAITALVV